MRYEFDLIVHPAGQLDAEGAAGYWTEVVALPACAAEGQSIEEAVENSRKSIVNWLSKTAAAEGNHTELRDILVSVNINVAV